MFDLDGADPQPETSSLKAKDLDEFRSEAARFQHKRRARGGKKQGGQLFLLVIAVILLFGFILAVAWAAVQSYSSMRPRPQIGCQPQPLT